jgi:DNA-binding transcriptional MerR regulator
LLSRTLLPDKLFYKIGEVADLIGVKPHVLRYWESEFPSLRPMKTRGAHRVYKKRDVELAMLIRRLLHDEGYTTPGAKKRIRELGHDRAESDEGRGASREVVLRGELLGLREELQALLASLDAIVATRPSAPMAKSAIVHSATLLGAASDTSRAPVSITVPAARRDPSTKR